MSEVTPTLQIQIRDNSQEAARGVDALSTALERLRKAVSGGLGLGSVATEIDRLTSAVRVAKNDDVAGNLNKIASALSKLSNAKNAGTAPAVKQIEQLQDRYTGLTESANQAKEAIQAPLEAQASTTQTATKQITGEMEDVVKSAEKIRESVSDAKEGIGEGTVNTGSFTKGMTETMSVAEATGQISELADSATNLASAMQSVSDASISAESGMTGAVQVVDELPATAKSASFSLDDLQKKLKTLTRSSADTRRGFLGLFSSFMRIAKMRLFRTIIREIAEGFATGLKNVKAYSHYVGTSYYPATVKANQALLQMKNALGAASAPFLEALVPLLQTVTSWVITASNVFNQFVALLTGKTSWTRAIVPTAESLEETEQRARGASNKLKELLADWDELNIIQSESGGGGFGNPNNEEEQIRSMFEQVSAFDERIQKIVNFLKENMDRVRSIAQEIGILIGAWMVAPAFSGVLGMLLAIAMTGLTAKIVFDVKTMINNQYLSTGDDEWFLMSVLSTIVGGVVASQIIGGLISKQYAYLGWVLVLGVSAAADITAVIGNRDVSAFDEEGLRLSLLGALEAGGAAGIIGWKVIGPNMYSLLFAGGVALATLGVELTVEALLDVAEKREVPAETYLELALGSIGLAAGVGGITYAFAHSVPTAVAAGGIALGVVGVMTGVSALLRAEKFGVDESTWAALALASIETGVAVGALIHKFGHQSIAVSATAGLGAALLTVGVFGSVVALLQAGNVGVTDETWMQLAGSSVGVAIGGGLLAHSIGKMSVGYSALAGLSAGALVFGVSSGVVAVLEAQKAVRENGTAINAEVIKDMLLSSVGMGLGIFGAGFVLNWGTAVAAFAGGGAAAATLSVLLGVSAVIEATQSGVTESVVGEAIASSLLMGAAGALFAGITGAAVTTALATGGLVALATGIVIAAAIGIAVSLNAEKANVTWGKTDLTEEEIKTLVNEHFFSTPIPVSTVLEITSSKAKVRDEAIKSIQTTFANVINPKLNVLKLGLATEETKKDLLDAILGPENAEGIRSGGWIDEIQKSIDLSKQNLTFGFSLTPVIDSNGDDLSKELLASGLEGYTGIATYVRTVGEQLGKELSKGFTEDGLANFDRDLVAKLTDKLNKVTKAMNDAKVQSEAFANLSGELGNIDLTNLTRESFGDVMAAYAEYRNQLELGLKENYKAMMGEYASLEAAYRQMALDAESEAEKEEYTALAEKYAAEYQRLAEKQASSIAAAIDNYSEPGRKMIADAILRLYSGAFEQVDVTKLFAGNDGSVLEWLGRVYQFGATQENMQNLSDSFSDFLYDVVMSAFSEEDREILQKAMDAGVISVFDFLGEKDFEAIEKYFESTNVGPAAEKYKELIHSLWNTDDTEGAQGESGTSTAMKIIKESVEEVNGVLPVAVKSASDLTSAVVTAGQSFGDLDATTKNTSDNMVRNLDNATAAAKRLNAEIYRGALLGGIEPFTRGRIPSVPTVLRADGGFVTSGELFVAQEAGPEMIGRIGSRSAVANTDQIVSGIAGGVAAGQEEQNVLLRQQNEYLRRLLAKDSTVRVQPSAEWGKFNKRSEEMRLVNAGV